MMFKSLKRIVFQVSNVEQAKKWYQELLESEPLFASQVAAIFEIGDDSLTLAKASSSFSQGAPRTTAYWEVDDVDDSVKRLAAMGATVKMPPTSMLNIRSAQVVDPFGNVVGLTGNIPNVHGQTVENHPSETAHMIALCRSLMSRDSRLATHYADTFSDLFLRENVRSMLNDEASRFSVIDTMISRPLYGYLIARTAFIDEIFVRSLDDKIPQIVFLGAGYDTRALRFQSVLGGTRIYELDAATTQNRKKACLDAAGIRMPEQVSLIRVNFKTENFLDKLQQAGFHPALAALFIWEGVMYYLPQQVVDNTLDLIRKASTSTVGLCFDYMTKNLGSVSLAEPFLSWIDSSAMKHYLGRYGFRLADQLDSDRMCDRYLSLKDGTALEKPLSIIELAYAEK